MRGCVETLGDMLEKADAINRGSVQDKHFDLSRLTDEQRRQLKELLTIAYCSPFGSEADLLVPEA